MYTLLVFTCQAVASVVFKQIIIPSNGDLTADQPTGLGGDAWGAQARQLLDQHLDVPEQDVHARDVHEQADVFEARAVTSVLDLAGVYYCVCMLDE